MPVSPVLALGVLLLVTCVAVIAGDALRKGNSARLRVLSSKLARQFSPEDRFELASRIAPNLPVPGVGFVTVRDVMYWKTDKGYRYVVTVAGVVGLTHLRHWKRWVATWQETSAEQATDRPASPTDAGDGHASITEVLRPGGATTGNDPGGRMISAVEAGDLIEAYRHASQA